MGACWCCFPVYQPARENPMRSTRESLIQHKKNPTTPYHPPPPQFITYTGKGMNTVERFKTGFENFRNTIYDEKLELFERLKTGQSPKYMVFSCADSRVCPTLTFGLQPGEAFTVRNIAGMVPAYDKRRQCSIGSAIEYAVVVLKEAVNVSLRNLQSYPFVKERLQKGKL